VARAIELARNVDIEGPAESLVADVLDICRRSGDAGIVDQHIDPAPGVVHGFEELRHLRWIADIGPFDERTGELGLPSSRAFVDVAHGDDARRDYETPWR
jgi:hypothetical protein